jgi:hypothetical protein
MEAFYFFVIMAFAVFLANGAKLPFSSRPPKPPPKQNRKPINRMPTSNLISCPDCAGQHSRLAEMCPHCGRPTELKVGSDLFKTVTKNEQDRIDHYNPFKRISRIFGGK